MISASLPAFLPFDLPSDFDALVALAERIENRDESGERTYELYARCERVLGWFDVHGGTRTRSGVLGRDHRRFCNDPERLST